ncbi:MAG: hypothetical protein QOH71_561 [Blastocatellia bacterium]|jgi:hypothetical protein|nr:hypothetical protein [Blastocatellia bacterium]
MDRTEALQLLGDELQAYKRRSYDELIQLVDRTEHYDRSSPSGKAYQIDIQVLWDEEPKGTIRVIGAIDDGQFLSTMFPLSSDFIMSPDGLVRG